MDSLLNYIYYKIRENDAIKVYSVYHGIINYYYYFKKENKEETIYCYLNLRKIFSSIITFIIFIIFYYFNIQILPEKLISVLILMLFIFFIRNIILIVIYLIQGVYLKYKKNDDVLFDKVIIIILNYINFLINISIIYNIFNLEINILLQYNIIFVIDLIYNQSIKVYNYILNKEIEIKKTQNFITYPYVSMLVLYISMYNKTEFKYYCCLYFTDYVYIFNIELDSVFEKKI